jgi:hypothetical protein
MIHVVMLSVNELSVIVLSVIMLSVIMLSVIVLSVVAPGEMSDQTKGERQNLIFQQKIISTDSSNFFTQKCGTRVFSLKIKVESAPFEYEGSLNLSIWHYFTTTVV